MKNLVDMGNKGGRKHHFVLPKDLLARLERKPVAGPFRNTLDGKVPAIHRRAIGTIRVFARLVRNKCIAIGARINVTDLPWLDFPAIQKMHEPAERRLKRLVARGQHRRPQLLPRWRKVFDRGRLAFDDSGVRKPRPHVALRVLPSLRFHPEGGRSNLGQPRLQPLCVARHILGLTIQDMRNAAHTRDHVAPAHIGDEQILLEQLDDVGEGQ